jgi:hypothetical protein
MGRGPSYPYIGLEEAITFARKFYDYAKRGSAPTDSAISEAWKYSPTSSSGHKVLAALKAFGLLEDAAGSNGKAIKLTSRAIRILLDAEDSEERRAEIKKAALSPKWYAYCWKTWGKEAPLSMKSNLLIEHGFVDTTVEGFLKDYRKTISFAGLLTDSIQEKGEMIDEPIEEQFRIGDYVQWESRGELKMPFAKRLVRFVDSQIGKFAFVEGEATGIPATELIAADPPEKEELDSDKLRTDAPPVNKLPINSIPTLQESFSLPNGSSVTLVWPASFTPEAFEDFSDWLKLVQRKIGRTVKALEEENRQV